MGTGEKFTGFTGLFAIPGLVSVSADGVDAYFATLDQLVTQDHNGEQLKIYDARTNGGFAADVPPPNCEAADECHGPGSSGPAALVEGTAPNLGKSGNVVAKKKAGKKRRPARRSGQEEGQEAARSQACRRSGAQERGRTMKAETMQGDRRGRPWTPKLLAARASCSRSRCWPASLAASPADASVAIRSFEASPSTTQAGGHPDVTVVFSNEHSLDPETGDPCWCNNLRDAKVSLPAGVIGNPHATPRCSTMEFAQDICPVDSQVGVAIADVALFGCSPCYQMKVPLYNLMPLPNQAALLGFKAFLFSYPTYTVLSARTDGDYGLDAQVAAVNQSFALARYEQVLWGVPAAKVNDGERFKSGGAFPVDPPAASNSPEIPFLQNPTTCSGPLRSDLEVIAYDHGVTHASAPWPATTGCDQLSFNPSLSAQPSTPQTDTASGLDVDLDVPQILNPSTPSASQIRSATITLPEGFSINPNAADGKTSCSDAEARIGTTEEASCPEQAKVGSLSPDQLGAARARSPATSTSGNRGRATATA